MKFPSLSQLCLTSLMACVTESAILAQPPVPADTSILRNLAYVREGHERQKLDLYLPGKGTSRPLLVWIHGGGWEGGSKENPPALPMLARGYAVASINYRLSQHAPFPAQIEDCKAAIRWLRAHASEHGIDAERIGVWGASAGGHLAALLGVTEHTQEFDKGEYLDQSSRVSCVLDWFGPSDFLNWGNTSLFDVVNPRSPVVKLLGGPLRDKVEVGRRASPVTFVKKNAAPFLILHGDADPLVPLQQSQALHAALQKAGVDSRLEILQGAAHGGAAFLAAGKIALMTDFLEKHLRPAR